MRSFLISTIGMLLAFFASIFMLVVLFVAGASIRAHERPATDYLPATATLAYATNLTDEAMVSLAAWLPDWEGIPTGYTEAALLTDGEQRFVVLLRERSEILGEWDVPEGWVSAVHGKYLVLTPIGYGDFIHIYEEPLTLYEPFVALEAKIDTFPGVYLDPQLLPDQLGIFDRMVLNTPSHALLSLRGSDVRWDFYVDQSVRLKHVELTNFYPDEWFTVAAPNLAILFEEFSTKLPEHEHMVLAGFIDQWVHDRFGEAVSFDYDLMPMFSRAQSLHLSLTGSGSIGFLLRGQVSHMHQFETIDGLHDAFLAQAPTTSILDREFDDFTLRTAVSDDAHSQSQKKAVNGWQVRASGVPNEGRQLLSAIRSRDWVLSNNSQLLSYLISEDDREAAAIKTQRGHLVFRLQLKDVQSFFAEHLPFLVRHSWSKFVAPEPGTLQLIVDETRNMRTLWIERLDFSSN